VLANPAITVVIPTLGRSESLRDVLVALSEQSPSVELNVVIVVDAAGTSPDRFIAPGLPLLEVSVLSASRPGASAARNTGWRAANSGLILFIDDDIVASPQLISQHLNWHAHNPEPEVGVLGRVRWSPRVKVSPFMRWLETGILFDFDGIQGRETDCWHFYTCNVSVKREMLERVGGFDDVRFPFRYEDLDIARRMSDHGFRLLFNSDALGDHLKTETLEGWRQKLDRIAVSERRFTELYDGEIPAYFYERFSDAARAPRAHGRSARLARFIPPGVPGIGPVVWRSFDRVCAQQLADTYLASWAAAETATTDTGMADHARNAGRQPDADG
jgi:GT2 family glycosyltransferase